MTTSRASAKRSSTAGVPRDQLFITSKLSNGGHARDLALKSFDETMKKLGLDQLDLFLIHWPVPSQDKYVEAWKTLVELQKQGRIKSIGVSNFNQDHLERIIKETGVTPVVNQIELHPRFQQRDKRDFHSSTTSTSRAGARSARAACSTTTTSARSPRSTANRSPR